MASLCLIAIIKKVSYTLVAGVVWCNKNMYLKQEILGTFEKKNKY